MKIKIPYKTILLFGIILYLNIIFLPAFGSKRFNFKEGEIAAEDVIAPYDFSIYKTEQELLEERNEIAQRLPPVYDYKAEVIEELESLLSNLERCLDTLKSHKSRDTIIYIVQKEFGLPKDVVSYLLKNNYKYTLKRLLKDLVFYLSKGIISNKSLPHRILIIVHGNKETLVSIDEIYSISEVESLLTINTKGEYRQMVKFLNKPNVIFNRQKTTERIDEVFANRKKTKGEVLKGELIVEKHKRITPEAMGKIMALEGTYTSYGIWQILKTFFFRNLFFFSLFLFLFYFSNQANIKFFAEKNFYFITTLLVAYIAIGRISYVTNTVYLLPIAFFSILFSFYFNPLAGLCFTILCSSIFGVIYNSLPTFLYLIASGIAGCLLTQSIKNRFFLYLPVVYLSLTNVIVIFFIDNYLSKTGINLLDIGAGILNGLGSIVALAIFLPLIEKIFDFTTNITLLELGNLNLPIFKEMSMKAPGTYHHSVVVGNLAEAGATAIGADPILARVGAYYHDIGKLKKPEYFIENQIGQKNPHDNLKPQMSALVIISHVKDGYEMGKDMKLPKNILSIISEHHGTSRIESFYRKALHSAEKISEDVFSYPGPKPKTKEAALVMLADAVEASARAERNITVTKLQRILKENFDKRFSEGQLDECPINRVDIEHIKTAFLPILMGIFHPRVDYEEGVSNKD